MPSAELNKIVRVFALKYRLKYERQRLLEIKIVKKKGANK